MSNEDIAIQFYSNAKIWNYTHFRIVMQEQVVSVKMGIEGTLFLELAQKVILK